MSARLTVVLLVLLCALPAAAYADAPPNDDKNSPTVITDIPARLQGTTVEATTETDDPGSRCASSRNSVYYQFRAGSDGRIFVQMDANGDLDGVVDVLRKVRSQLQNVGCDATDKDGFAAVGFNVKDGDTYLIRVAQLNNSVEGTFSLNVDRAQPAATAPGAPLPAGGRHDTVDRVLNPSDSWSVRMHSGRSYRINLSSPVDEDRVRCVRLRVFGPNTRSLADSSPKRTTGCGGGYILFTPRPGQGGRYTLVVRASSGRGAIPYNIEFAGAGSDDTAPGVFVRNDVTLLGDLSGNRVDVIDLYRFDVKKRSVLNLTLRTSSSFDLLLLNDTGHRIECSCFGSGEQSIQRQIRPGRYFAAVRAQGTAAGSYRLTRISRTITQTRIFIDGHKNGLTAPGSAFHVEVTVSPGASGPLRVLIERFDPLAGWLFVSRINTTVSGGSRTISFTPPTVGRWRARARFLGTRTASPSGSRYARTLVAGPLTE